MRHELKTWPEPFQAIVEGQKRHEVRAHDRPFRRGDTVVLLEYDPIKRLSTGRNVVATIGYISIGPEWDLPEGVCVFTLLAINAPFAAADAGSR